MDYDKSITHNLDHYMDMTHYHLMDHQKIISLITKDLYKVGMDNINIASDILRKQVADFFLSDLIFKFDGT